VRKLIAGNWKMNGLRAEAEQLARGLAERTQSADAPACDWAVCPPFTMLVPVAERLVGSPVMLGGQDCHPEPKGAHTGDVSAAMLADLCCGFVIVGHSERRQNHDESDALVKAKAEAARREELTPILCIGETERQRESGKTLAILEQQLGGSLPSADHAEAGLVVAYEPVWAIGTGNTATPEDVEEAHRHIRGLLRSHYGADAGARVRILYGGSVKAENAGDLLGVPDVDGALVGGASLKLEDFWAIGRAAG
jgi:triosephosphate isomerase